ncbi:hypothetical protein D0Y50_03585 [Salinimonas sediminis]|uniref:Uncharacterized protein n=1 Tax=Salinimonas sediminis TaxID=2303538 RepID=A0A346NJ26_9ALTE|nr:hypothetical protein D0Y50_03585 [Salinimonas sediminis]
MCIALPFSFYASYATIRPGLTKPGSFDSNQGNSQGLSLLLSIEHCGNSIGFLRFAVFITGHGIYWQT